jgi:hypothetical protein
MHISFTLGIDRYMSCTRILMVRMMFQGVEGDIPECVQHSTCHSWSHFPHILLPAIWMYIMWSWYSEYYYIVGKPLSIQTTLLDIDAGESVLFNLLLQFMEFLGLIHRVTVQAGFWENLCDTEELRYCLVCGFMDTGHVHVAEYLKVPLHVYFTMPWTYVRFQTHLPNS